MAKGKRLITKDFLRYVLFLNMKKGTTFLHRSFFLKITYYRKYHDLTYNHFLVTTSIFCFHDNQINSGIASLVYAYFARSVVCLIH